ncbi:transglycosylase domain-containing protein [Agromyces seonyuensis]|uniref:PASTA domain-containing protein n=1 Tax=Agromyces seonyuensis TaxID=2662446 RepID=A0A6I4NX23_9MICO|nr:transglycosylase domain-containing protein [Agromyces seonyuensis]MWB98731.1 PASTA domain-containing protein [Agromyces seonyuensis]
MSDPKRPSSNAPDRRTMLEGIAGFLGVSILSGVLVAASMAPAIAVSGSVTSSGLNLFENLPNYLEIDALPQKSTMFATGPDGQPVRLADFYQDNRESIPLDKMSQFAKDAAVAGEDARFYEHGGVDLTGTIRAVVATTSGSNVQGGSSITQQFVKNVLINNGVSEAKTDEEKQAAYEEATATTPARKLKEMRYAIAIEKKYSKDQILEGYLNIAHFGGITYGIQAASKYYYGVDNSQLTVAQAASIIAITQSPNTLRLDRPDSETNGAASGYALNKDRRDYIIDAMLAQGMIDQAQHDEAINTVIEPHITPSTNGCQTAGADGSSGFFCDYVTKIIQNELDDETTPDVNEGTQMLKTGGLQIFTTLDLDLQNSTVEALNANVPQHLDSVDIGSVSVTVQPGTGKVLAMAQNKKYSQDSTVTAADPTYTSVNYSTDYEYGGSTGFQPGSTFKVFTLAAWLTQGHSLYESFNGSLRPITVSSCEGTGGTWKGGNDDGAVGNNAVDATKFSINSSYLAMAEKMDLCDVKTAAQSFGVHRADGNDLKIYPAGVLGTEEVAPLTMAAAYAGIANDGVYCSPIGIERIVKADGTDQAVPTSACSASVTTDVAHAMQFAMQQVFEAGATATKSNTYTGVPHIGKTGTTDKAVATWMTGASTKAATAVWVGNVQGFQSMRNLTFDSGLAQYARHRIWKAVMTTADNKYGGDAFGTPPDSLLKETKAAIPNVIGMSLEAAQQAIEDADFVFEHGGDIDSSLPAGQVAQTDPSGEAGLGSTIRVFTSNGKGLAVPNVVGQTVQQAQAALIAAGFKVKVPNKAQPEWIVSSQSPGAGSASKQGDTITLKATEPVRETLEPTTEPTPDPGTGGGDGTGGTDGTDGTDG